MPFSYARGRMFQCPLCSGRTAVWRAQIGEYQIGECRDCGVQSTYPLPSPDLLRAVYADGYYGGPDAARFRFDALQRVVRFFRWLRARMLQRRLGRVAGRRILDVGCGRGDMLGWLHRWGADVHGTEVSPAAARAASTLVGSDRISVGELADAKYPSASFDCITLWHVLEHVRAPDFLLREVARVLRPGGFAYIEVPNADSWSARRFGGRWLAYDVPKHLFHFSPEALKALAGQAGLRCVRENHFSMEYTPVTLLQTVLSAAFGGDSLLFRRLTTEGAAPGDARGRLPRLMLHLLAATVLAVPVAITSVFLSWRRTGDTFGVYVERA